MIVKLLKTSIKSDSPEFMIAKSLYGRFMNVSCKRRGYRTYKIYYHNTFLFTSHGDRGQWTQSLRLIEQYLKDIE